MNLTPQGCMWRWRQNIQLRVLRILRPAQSCLLTTCQDLPGTISQLVTSSSCQGHKAVLCDAVVACILPGQGSRMSRSAQATVDNGATVGSGPAAKSVQGMATQSQVQTRLPRWAAGQGVIQQSPGQLEPGQAGQHPGRLCRHLPGPDFPVLSLPGGPS